MLTIGDGINDAAAPPAIRHGHRKAGTDVANNERLMPSSCAKRILRRRQRHCLSKAGLSRTIKETWFWAFFNACIPLVVRVPHPAFWHPLNFYGSARRYESSELHGLRLNALRLRFFKIDDSTDKVK